MPGRTRCLSSLALVALLTTACAKSNEPPPGPAAKPATATIKIRPTVEPIVEEESPAIEAVETEMPAEVVERPHTQRPRRARTASRPEQLDDVVTPAFAAPAPAPDVAAAPVEAEPAVASASPAAEAAEPGDDGERADSEPRKLMLSDELLGDM